MNNPTDTNQASEDELAHAIEEILVDDLFYDEKQSRLLALIRTEKLKLLAEVRERVVGEDKPQYQWGDGTSKSLWYEAQYKLRAMQTSALNKMEAEL